VNCRICGISSNDKRVVNSPKYGIVCINCYNRERISSEVHELPKYGEITLDNKSTIKMRGII
jgi:hypothetical protein